MNESENQPLRSVHTSNLPDILSQWGISLLVSTYQAGKLVVLRADDGVLNTHFRVFDKPMGMAVQPHRIALGTAMQVWEFHNISAACTRLDTARERSTICRPVRRALTRTTRVSSHASHTGPATSTCIFDPICRPSFIAQYIHVPVK